MRNLRPVFRIVLMVIALMSGILSLLREGLQITNPAKYQEKSLFSACLYIAFMVAMVLLWWEERCAKIEAETALNDTRPRLGLRPNSLEGPKAWADSGEPVAFTIQHLSGRVPTSIRFDPVPSKLGRFSLQFDPLPYALSPQPEGVGFDVIETGAPPLSAKDRETTRSGRKEMLGLFLNDSPENLTNLDYLLVARFLDGTQLQSQAFRLRFETARYRFSEDTSAADEK